MDVSVPVVDGSQNVLFWTYITIGVCDELFLSPFGGAFLQPDYRNLTWWDLRLKHLTV